MVLSLLLKEDVGEPVAGRQVLWGLFQRKEACGFVRGCGVFGVNGLSF